MAYWSSTNFDQYAEHGLWNVKPRWQELAEHSSSFSPPVSEPIPCSDRMASNPDHFDGDPRYRTRRATWLHRDNNAAELGASPSQSRSRSRPRRLPTRMSREPSSSRQRQRSILERAFPYTPSKRTMFLSFLAVVNIVLSWFGFGIFSYSGPLVRSIVGNPDMNIGRKRTISSRIESMLVVPLVYGVQRVNVQILVSLLE